MLCSNCGRLWDYAFSSLYDDDGALYWSDDDPEYLCQFCDWVGKPLKTPDTAHRDILGNERKVT